MSALILVSIAPIAFAVSLEEKGKDSSIEAYDELAQELKQETITLIEADLEDNNTSIVQEMNELIEIYRAEQLNCNDPQDFAYKDKYIDCATEWRDFALLYKSE